MLNKIFAKLLLAYLELTVALLEGSKSDIKMAITYHNIDQLTAQSIKVHCYYKQVIVMTITCFKLYVKHVKLIVQNDAQLQTFDIILNLGVYVQKQRILP